MIIVNYEQQTQQYLFIHLKLYKVIQLHLDLTLTHNKTKLKMQIIKIISALRVLILTFRESTRNFIHKITLPK